MDKRKLIKWLKDLPDGWHYFAKYFKDMQRFEAKSEIYNLIQSGELEPQITLEMSEDFTMFRKVTRKKTHNGIQD